MDETNVIPLPELDLESIHPFVNRDFQVDDGVVVLRAVGEFDVASADVMSVAFSGALDDHRCVVLDLAATGFLDCTTLSEFIVAQKRAARRGGWVRLGDPRPNVRKVLHLTALDSFIGLYDTVEQARTGVRLPA